MIFVTVGTQLPFDRMVSGVDVWAEKSGNEVFAQVGPSTKVFPSIKQAAFLEPKDFDHYFSLATLVIAHAGMGSILTALSYGKPIIIMPRQAELGEHRNDHQMATARRFLHQPGVRVAWSEQELTTMLDASFASQGESGGLISPHAPDDFIRRLRDLIQSSTF